MTGAPAPGPELVGRAASPGLAAGPVVVVDRVVAGTRPAGDPDAEAARLLQALETASAQIAGLMETVDAEAAEMLEFQLAMLEDEELTAPARAAIAGGASAAAAFAGALDAAIADYRASDDEYFRARSADLADIRERVLRALSGEEGAAVAAAGAVLVGTDLTPTRFLETDWSAGGGIVLAEGSPSSHVAMLARARGVPMVTGLGAFDTSDLKEALVDGDSGRVRFNPDEVARRQHASLAQALAREAEAAKTYLGRPAVTACGVPVSVMINVAAPAEIDTLDPAHCDGIGLMRTEFLFHGPGGLPDEDSQYRAYRKVLEWAGGRSVTIRTLDAGGDKPVPGLTVEESNPFLGCRGIRLSLRRPDVFRVQLRALARAGCHGNLQVMLPMVSVPEEIAEAARLLDGCVAELRSEGYEAVRPPLGIMVEVPAVAVTPERFAAAAFFSIGSNDLTQYVLAAGRDSPDVAALGRADDPAVLALVASTLRGGATAGLPVGLCGDAGSDLAVLPKLLACGLRRVSVAPAALARVKAAIAGMRLGDDG
ncbi:phosphoenolpyruvate--protein phosphotransferase [Stappia sp. WLB 29]|uniref:phosphoenolpyruvate--protein phosphotransferase n=1 Tax=Stappia sp. WLB 29 TaxID=2925220 RepID=UPI0020BF0E58|nr:phosphoenolpyruvate--protein phosphotransferase [Stappia sp. WLB 29]